MTKNPHGGRKGGRTARMPAMKFPKLQKQMRKAKTGRGLKGKKG